MDGVSFEMHSHGRKKFVLLEKRHAYSVNISLDHFLIAWIRKQKLYLLVPVIAGVI